MPKFLLGFNQPHNIYLFSLATNGIVGSGRAALHLLPQPALRGAGPAHPTAAGKLFAFLAMATAVHFMIAGFMDSFFNIQVLRYSFAFIMGVCIRSAATCARRPSARCPPP